MIALMCEVAPSYIKAGPWSGVPSSLVLLYTTIARTKTLEEVEHSVMNQKPSSAYYVPINFEEHDDFTPQKRLKLDSEASTSKSNSFTSREDGITTSQRDTKKFLSGGSKVEVSLVNADQWKELCEIGNEMRIDYQTT